MPTVLLRVLDAISDRTGIVVVRARLPYAASDDEVTIDLPGYRQANTFACGFVAGLSVLHTFKPRASIDRFYRDVSPDSDNGTPASRLMRALKSRGVNVRPRYDLNFGKFSKVITQGRPVITCINPPRSEESHWVVVYGVGQRPNRLFISGNGWLRNAPEPWSTFRGRWTQPGYGIVCSA